MKKCFLFLLLILPGSLWAETEAQYWHNLTIQQKNDIAFGFAIGFTDSVQVAEVLADKIQKDSSNTDTAFQALTQALSRYAPTGKEFSSRFQAYAISFIDNFFATPGNESEDLYNAFNMCLLSWNNAVTKDKTN